MLLFSIDNIFTHKSLAVGFSKKSKLLSFSVIDLSLWNNNFHVRSFKNTTK